MKQDNEPDVMVYVYPNGPNGYRKNFYCECGCNVFHHPKERPDRYECNACEAWYIAEEEPSQDEP